MMTSDHVQRYRMATGGCGLGAFAIGASARGLAALVFGRTPADAIARLAEALPDARLDPAASDLAPMVERVTALIDRPASSHDLPIDLDGSPIELAVWRTLRTIPAGETRSYGAIARALPVAATAQEVGTACAANRVAVAIPCHRVVKSDGSIAGYRWGVHRKRRLLAMERAVQA